MKKLILVALCLISIAASITAVPAAADPAITSTSASTLERSGRLLIEGSGFGTTQGTSRVSIAGLTAPSTRWSDTLVVAYVPEAASLGPADVQLIVNGKASNAVPLLVTARVGDGRVRWRFQVDAQFGYLLQRPATGLDGTVVAHDPAGNVYALTPDGGLKWTFKTAGFAAGPPSIGADGSIYVAAGSTIYALAPDGKLRWSFTEPPGGQGVIVGPTVGPDGNVYAVTDLGGLGALALSPTGQLLWSNPGNPAFDERGQIGAEVAFGSLKLYGGVDQGTPSGGVLHALTLSGTQVWAVPAGASDNSMQGQRQPTVGSDGTVYMTANGRFSDPCNGSCLYAFDPANGGVKWVYSPFPANGMSEPTVGADGTIYVGRSLSFLDAVTSGGAARWSIFDGGILNHPTVDPRNIQVVAGDAPNFGLPGSVRSFSAADGHVLWDLPLPSENGGFQVLYSRPRFAADGTTVYFGTFISAPNSPDQYANLYAVDTSASPPVSLASLTLHPAQVTGGSPSTGIVVLTGAAPSGGAVVVLSSNKGAAIPPASVTVPAGSSSASFSVKTKTVKRTRRATISAVYAGTTKSAVLTIVP